MQRESRSELARTCESQKEQIEKYEKKLRDVVRAYRALQAEKEVLSTTLHALGESAKGSCDESPGNKQTSEDGAVDPSASVGDGADESDGGDTEVMKLKRKLATLTETIAAINKQKDLMVASYQEEKKHLREENEEKMRHLQTELSKKEKSYEELTSQSQQWKSRLVTEQRDREKDQDNHETILQQLQKLLEAERIQREYCEHQLEDVRSEAQRKQGEHTELLAVHEERNKQQRDELIAVRKSVTQTQREDMSAEVTQLQRQLAQMKLDGRRQLQQEEQRSLHAEQQLSSERSSSEQRLLSLEAQLTQLSEQVVVCERAREQEALTSASLRERCSQHHHHGGTMSREGSASGLGTGPTQGRHGGATTMDSMLRQLHETVQRSQHEPQVIELLQDFGIDVVSLLRRQRSPSTPSCASLPNTDTGESHEDSRLHQSEQMYQKLKLEFDEYKLRAQSVFKNNANKDRGDMERWQQEASSLRSQVEHLQMEKSRHEQRMTEREEETKQTVECLLVQQQRAVSEAEEATERQTQLEGELKRMRQRTVAMLVDKDRQIEYLTPAMTSHVTESAVLYSDTDSVRMPISREQSVDSIDGGVTQHVAELLDQPSVPEGSLLHFAEERARSDLQLARLRREKHSLEATVRQFHQQVALQAEQAEAQRQQLIDKVKAIERSQARDNANLEYLKNVVHRYMVCESASGRLPILNAIATILQFSSQEKSAVERRLRKGWWTHAERDQ